MGRATGAFCGARVCASRRAEVAPDKEIEIFPTTTLPYRSLHIFCFSDWFSLKNTARKFRAVWAYIPPNIPVHSRGDLGGVVNRVS